MVPVGQVTALVALERCGIENEREGRAFQTGKNSVPTVPRHNEPRLWKHWEKCGVHGAWVGEEQGPEREIGTSLGRASCAHSAFMT